MHTLGLSVTSLQHTGLLLVEGNLEREVRLGCTMMQDVCVSLLVFGVDCSMVAGVIYFVVASS